MTRSVIIKIREAQDEAGNRYVPPASPTRSPGYSLMEAVGEAFNSIAQDYNVARHQNLGEAFIPSKADFHNRKMYNHVAPDLGINTKERDVPYVPIPRYQVRPRRAGDWLCGTSHKDRFHLLPTVIPMTEQRMISEKKAATDLERRPGNYNFVRSGLLHGVQRTPVALVQPDYGSSEIRSRQRRNWAGNFDRNFHGGKQSNSIVFSYCSPL